MLSAQRLPPQQLLQLLEQSLRFARCFAPRGARQPEGAEDCALSDIAAALPNGAAAKIAAALGTIDAPRAAAARSCSEDCLSEAVKRGASFGGLRLAYAQVSESEAALLAELESVRSRLKRPRLEWRTLRTGFGSSVECLAEVGVADARTVPSDWTLVSKTKSLLRYHSPRTPALLAARAQAREQLALACAAAWAQHLRALAADAPLVAALSAAATSAARLDALLSLAAVSSQPGYCRPEYRPAGGTPAWAARKLRHPVLEHVVGDMVANDVELAPGGALVLTGPNMGGKSSLVRAAALVSIMGQVGCHVPCESARLCAFDALLTRMGAGDDLAGGLSTFLHELRTTARILRGASSRSLVVLDELGRGTSTHDGAAIAAATLRHIVREIGPACLFVTHYPQIVDELAGEEGMEGLRPCHMGFLEGDDADELTLLYTLKDGVARRSYGLHTARLAGVKDAVLQDARRVAAAARAAARAAAGGEARGP